MNAARPGDLRYVPPTAGQRRTLLHRGSTEPADRDALLMLTFAVARWLDANDVAPVAAGVASHLRNMLPDRGIDGIVLLRLWLRLCLRAANDARALRTRVGLALSAEETTATGVRVWPACAAVEWRFGSDGTACHATPPADGGRWCSHHRSLLLGGVVGV
jgi:hypothetical protein